VRQYFNLLICVRYFTIIYDNRHNSLWWSFLPYYIHPRCVRALDRPGLFSRGLRAGAPGDDRDLSSMRKIILEYLAVLPQIMYSFGGRDEGSSPSLLYMGDRHPLRDRRIKWIFGYYRNE
jgi:hypothetical protein